MAQRARHWLAEIARNNAVVTLDVPGAVCRRQEGPAGRRRPQRRPPANAALSRRRPQDLLAVESRIGEDFIYRDYGLDIGGRAELRPSVARHARRATPLWPASVAGSRCRNSIPKTSSNSGPPTWPNCRRWTSTARTGTWRDDDWDDEDDREAEFFGDRCEQFRERLQKSYRPGWDKASSWQCDRLLEIPAAALKEPGAYILVVEANGQTVYAPVLVDPLSLVCAAAATACSCY